MRSISMMLKVTQLCVIILSVTFFHLSFASLFESCDESYQLDSDDSITIESGTTLNARNVSSCRISIIAPANYIVKVKCTLQFDQLNFTFCPTKRFFISVDGIMTLHHAHNFCNRNGTTRVIKRRSVMNRLVMAYVSKRDLEDEKYTCIASRVKRNCDCGWSRRARIYNGENAMMHEFPSMIALVAISINKIFCGGVIITERHGLTGAHCFNEPEYADIENIAAFVGEHDLKTHNETIYTESYELEGYIRHEGFMIDPFNQNHDIAVVKTKLPIAFNLAVGPACLPFNFQHDAFDGKYVYAIGYGFLTYMEPEQATILQKVSLQILPTDKCEFSMNNTDKMCTFEREKDSCISDSGGPLVYFAKGRQFVVGLISYGIGCGSIYPSVNTRITSYLEWILKNTNGEILCRK